MRGLPSNVGRLLLVATLPSAATAIAAVGDLISAFQHYRQGSNNGKRWKRGRSSMVRSRLVTAVVAAAVAMRITMTTTTIRSAMRVRIHDLPNGVGRLPPIMIAPRNLAARFALSCLMIAV
jgi:hypothetical protein